MISATISECMTSDFAHISPSMPVAEASAKLIKKEIAGAPVIDEKGKLLGWISEQECLKVTLQVVYHNMRVATVEEVMRTDVVSIHLNEDPINVAQQMLGAKPKNYPVVDENDKVIGVITRRRILEMLERKRSEMPHP
ncbi:MAG: CBS domain-containing protein [Pontibacterium sp.]